MRYLPLTESDRNSMLQTVGVDTVDELFRDVPEAARLPGPLSHLPSHAPEFEVEGVFSKLAAANLSPASAPFFLGAGAYRHHIPAAVDHLIQRGEFLTSYTPYQPEVSQGTLQYLFEFQTQVALLTGMEIANASMYDGASACAEAVMMANRVTKRRRAIVSGNLHPHYREVVATQGKMTGFEFDLLPPAPGGEDDPAPLIDESVSCVVVQNPDLFGHIRDFSRLAEACHAKGALLIVTVTEILSLGILTPPGAMGADIVVGEGQSLGNGLSFGGPYLGLFACRAGFVRQMPGRICGATKDSDGKRGFVLTLSAREQHIRREKATSNICTNSGLCALAFTIHCALLGDTGMRHLAALNHSLACAAADRLAAIKGIEVVTRSYFNEFAVRLPVAAAPVVERLADRGILAGVPVSRFYPEEASLSTLLLIAVTELTADDDLEALCRGLSDVLGQGGLDASR